MQNPQRLMRKTCKKFLPKSRSHAPQTELMITYSEIIGSWLQHSLFTLWLQSKAAFMMTLYPSLPKKELFCLELKGYRAKRRNALQYPLR
jgi:hypothetical protein